MKKTILAVALAAAALTVPMTVSARQGSDDGRSGSDVRRENRREDRRVGTTATTVDTNRGAVRVESRVQLPSDSISLDRAIATANATLPGKTLKKVEIEQRQGSAIYSVRFTDGSRVDVRAGDAQVTRIKDRANKRDRNVRSTVSDERSSDDSRRSGGRGRDHAEDS